MDRRRSRTIFLAAGLALLCVALITWYFWPWVRTIDVQWLLVGVATLLTVISGVAWVRSNHAEARPNQEELEEMKRFVEEDFAAYVARGLARSGSAGDGALTAVSVARDPAWRRVFVQHMDLHNELGHLSKRTALSIYSAHVDAAVRRQLAALSASDTSTAREGRVPSDAPREADANSGAKAETRLAE